MYSTKEFFHKVCPWAYHPSLLDSNLCKVKVMWTVESQSYRKSEIFEMLKQVSGSKMSLIEIAYCTTTIRYSSLISCLRYELLREGCQTIQHSFKVLFIVFVRERKQNFQTPSDMTTPAQGEIFFPFWVKLWPMSLRTEWLFPPPLCP